MSNFITPSLYKKKKQKQKQKNKAGILLDSFVLITISGDSPFERLPRDFAML